ncbi:biopolymer transporter Tol [Opitutaceae bacterium TAV5]|nr:biopolymer transporter Tol [Opitutaceae bacterium TAV5]
MNRGILALAFAAVFFPQCPAAAIRDLSSGTREVRLTSGPLSHDITNFGVWSPDGEWIVCDERTESSEFTTSRRILRVHAETGAAETLHEAAGGGSCGVVTHSPVDDRAVFIAGPDHPTPEWSYGFSRRRGVWVHAASPGESRPLDANAYAPPFVPGALRGGSHVHVFSGDGRWVSFTYEDEVLRLLEGSGIDHDANQRNVGVAVPQGPVVVNRNHPRNHDGDFFSVLVTRTVADPAPGSDEISRACEEGWVGRSGYRRGDGQWQKKALAFQGTVKSRPGGTHQEVFIVDLPEDVTLAGDAPLEGTATRRPAPPRGTAQRRLTFTDERPFPGLQGPRHWLRSSPDGATIAFLMKDERGIVQLWGVSPNGGLPRQISRHPWNIDSAFSWSGDGRFIAHVMDGSVFLTEAATGDAWRLTAKTTDSDAPMPGACVISPDGSKIAFGRRPRGTSRPQVYFVTVPQVLSGEKTESHD